MTASLNLSLTTLRALADDPAAPDPAVVRHHLRVARSTGADGHRVASEYAWHAFGPEVIDLLLDELHPDSRGQRIWPLLRGMPEELAPARRLRALAWRRWERALEELRDDADDDALRALERIDEVARLWLIDQEQHRDAAFWLLREQALAGEHFWGERWGTRLMRRAALDFPELTPFISQVSPFEGPDEPEQRAHPAFITGSRLGQRGDVATFRMLPPQAEQPLVLRNFPALEEPPQPWKDALDAWASLVDPGFAFLYNHAVFLDLGVATVQRQYIGDGPSLQRLAEAPRDWADPRHEGSIAEIGCQLARLVRESIALTGLRPVGLHPRNVFVRNNGRVALTDPVGSPQRWPSEPPTERDLVCALVSLLAELQADRHGDLGALLRRAQTDPTLGLDALHDLLEPLATGADLLGARLFLP